jgi:hypothetical protein
MSELRNSARPFMRALYTNTTTRISSASQALAYRNSLPLSRFYAASLQKKLS